MQTREIKDGDEERERNVKNERQSGAHAQTSLSNFQLGEQKQQMLWLVYCGGY